MTSRPQKAQKNNFRTCPFDQLPCEYPCFKLKQARMSAGLSDDDVAQELDISRATWWRYKTGLQRPQRAVCSILNVLVGHLPWRGWINCFVNHREEKIYIDDFQIGLSLSDLRGYWWKLQLITAMTKTIAEQKKKIESLEWFSDRAVGRLS